ncbi:pantoate--beta-alanine ligase [Campylobacter suis]|uniref:Pantothenate synthetase n=1 Tax=Campylobacter suis TaxID=2790657 RepID=A0ABM8Q321_9BACT|nr:pantoate--beta-alanine ligase [Campylobacter suis]CAD7287244.1 Pantothenate synthetase [Campylobacter suis]
MKILRTTNELREFVLENACEIGFVPTMGALHDGHLSLIKQSVGENDITLVSTFVNPTQFLPGEDLDKYPKQEASDISICKNAGVDVMFIPAVSEIYSEFEPLILAPKNLAEILEGKTRPGHFDGVLRVLTKLFHLVCPKRVYMGKKDAQQLVIVQNMVKTMFFNTQIVPCEIMRDSDGLALSSRNSYLNEAQKKEALKLSRSLFKADELVRNGELNANEIKSKMSEILSPLEVDYIAIVDRNFAEISEIKLKNTIILVAAKVGKTRLIDNLWI